MNLNKLIRKYFIILVFGGMISIAIMFVGFLDYKYKKDIFEKNIENREKIRAEEKLIQEEKLTKLEVCLNEISNNYSTWLTPITNTISYRDLKDVLAEEQQKKDECFKKFK